ncbi:Ribonuclease G [Raoultella terrigena]|nr:Ribonuclease G [Raoultella terrigena]
MTAELLVNVTPSETRVAYIDGGILQEIHIEREARRGIVGNIYKGRVSRVLPGMQAAFVDIGLDKAAFLHASDIMPHTECVAGEEQKQFTVRDISELVRQGQDLMVQVVKDPPWYERRPSDDRYHHSFPLSGVYAWGLARWGFPAY